MINRHEGGVAAHRLRGSRNEPMDPNALLFREQQRFDQWWVILSLGMVAVFVAYKFWLVWQSGQPMHRVSWLLLGVPVLIILFFTTLRLDTEISTEGVRVRFFPFVDRFIPSAEIESATVRKYNPVTEFGGWGIRWGTKGRVAYSTRGDMAIVLQLRSGQTVYIGTRKPEEARQALRAAGLPVQEPIDQ